MLYLFLLFSIANLANYAQSQSDTTLLPDSGASSLASTSRATTRSITTTAGTSTTRDQTTTVKQSTSKSTTIAQTSSTSTKQTSVSVRTTSVAPSSTSSVPTTTEASLDIKNNNRVYYNYSVAAGSEKAAYLKRFAAAEKLAAPHVWSWTSNSSSASHSRFTLNFEFPFYGHRIRNILLHSDGYLYMNDFIHQFMKHSQYVAPFMAEFHAAPAARTPQFSVHQNDNRLFASWNEFVLIDDPAANTDSATTFKFQLILEASGKIIFYYKQIQDYSHFSTKQSIKHGVSDALYYKRNNVIYMYRYHAMSIDPKFVKSGNVIVLHNFPTCVSLRSCKSCLNPGSTSMRCYWCPILGKCSASGFDRNFAKWFRYGCAKTKLQKLDECHQSQKSKKNWRVGLPFIIPAIILLIIVICVALGLVVRVFVQAYRNPQSRLGEFLIKYRPSAIRQRKEDRKAEESSAYYHVAYST